MGKSLLSNLWHKAFHSGNPLYLFIALNILVFLSIHLLGLITTFNVVPPSWDGFMLRALRLPADFFGFLFKPWTMVTYMFTQVAFFHLLFNLLWLFWMGQIFLDFLNKKQFIFVYLAGGIAGAIVFLLSYNLIPSFADDRFARALIGSSASVSAIIFATATLLPDYSIRMLFFGNVKLKYLALVFIVLDILGIGGSNAGGSIAHIGGALFGVLYILQLQRGRDLSQFFSFSRRIKLKVIRNKSVPENNAKSKNQQIRAVEQQEIDKILDKISQNGYESLSKAEKDLLFKASKQEQKD